MLRILPRIGRGLLEERAFAVPSALSPRRGTARRPIIGAAIGELGGHGRGLQRVLAPRDLLVHAGGDPTRISETTLSMTRAACSFSPFVVEVRNSVSRSSTTFATIARIAGVPSTSLVCPSNWGSSMRTLTTAVRPARVSSFSIFSFFALNFTRRAWFSTCLRTVLTSACSKPVTCVPPLGVATMFTKERTVASKSAPQRRAMSTSHERSTRWRPCARSCPARGSSRCTRRCPAAGSRR